MRPGPASRRRAALELSRKHRTQRTNYPTMVVMDLLGMMSRRQAISAGGLVIAGAAGLASPAAPAHGIVFGSNRDPYPRLHDVVPLAKGIRMYYDTENVFPASWPDRFGA